MTGGHLFLVGFMGAGKSTVAQVVASHLGRPCIDLDAEIERTAGRPIARIFADEGEEVFRDLESDALESVEGREPAIVACGGGVVLRPENRAALKRMGTVFYLVVSPEEAVARVGDASTRPLLAGTVGTLAATTLLAAREALYRSVADEVVETVGRSSAQVADLVLERLEQVGK